MRDPRRTFSRAEVRRVWERQGRVCTLCERAIPFDLMHGDHIHPWIAGGLTVLENCQALCGSCNLRKGSQPQAVVSQHFQVDRLSPGTAALRRWQTEALHVVLPQILEKPTLVEACPGAGKTHFALEVAYRLLSSGDISRLIIVVPTLGICDGWLESASSTSKASPTIPLRGPRSWSPVNPIGDKHVGVVVTYQGLFFAPDMILAHATDPGHRTMVVFDEVHHAGAQSGWGIRAQEAFARSAAAILSLSGTPFRTDRDAIIFVPATRGEAQPDFSYGYERAIEEGACRPVQFVYGKGSTSFRTQDGEVHEVTFDDETLTTAGERNRLKTALEVVSDSSIAALLLHDANAYLLHLRRQGDADAAGLVVCADCDHADAVATFLTRVLGRRPVVAYSRLLDPADAEPANAIRDFKRGHEPWLVAVNMVSEGVDIRRLRVVVHLTNRLTLLSFRQIVGRVVRTDPRNVEDHGRVYLPADPSLVTMATTITNEVPLLPPPLTIVTDPAPWRVAIYQQGEDAGGVEFEPISSVGERGGATDTSRRVADNDLVELARAYVEKRNLTASDPVSLALAASENPVLRRAMEEELRRDS